MKYEWEVIYHPETGEYYLEQLVYMSLPNIIDGFETEVEAILAARKLNSELAKVSKNYADKNSNNGGVK